MLQTSHKAAVPSLSILCLQRLSCNNVTSTEGEEPPPGTSLRDKSNLEKQPAGWHADQRGIAELSCKRSLRDFLKHFSSPLTSLKWSTGSLWKEKKSRVWYMPWKAQAPEEYCHLLYLFAHWLCHLQEVYYSCCTFGKITPQISEARKSVLMAFKHFKCHHKNFKCVVCMYPMSHKLWAMCMGVKEFSQKQEVEQLFQYFMCLLKFAFNERKSGVFVLFWSLFPPQFPRSSLIYQSVNGHKQCKCMSVSACQCRFPKAYKLQWAILFCS